MKNMKDKNLKNLKLRLLGLSIAILMLHSIFSPSQLKQTHVNAMESKENWSSLDMSKTLLKYKTNLNKKGDKQYGLTSSSFDSTTTASGYLYSNDFDLDSLQKMQGSLINRGNSYIEKKVLNLKSIFGGSKTYNEALEKIHKNYFDAKERNAYLNNSNLHEYENHIKKYIKLVNSVKNEYNNFFNDIDKLEDPTLDSGIATNNALHSYISFKFDVVDALTKNLETISEKFEQGTETIAAKQKKAILELLNSLFAKQDKKIKNVEEDLPFILAIRHNMVSDPTTGFELANKIIDRYTEYIKALNNYVAIMNDDESIYCENIIEEAYTTYKSYINYYNMHPEIWGRQIETETGKYEDISSKVEQTVEELKMDSLDSSQKTFLNLIENKNNSLTNLILVDRLKSLKMLGITEEEEEKQKNDLNALITKNTNLEKIIRASFLDTFESVSKSQSTQAFQHTQYAHVFLANFETLISKIDELFWQTAIGSSIYDKQDSKAFDIGKKLDAHALHSMFDLTNSLYAKESSPQRIKEYLAEVFKKDYRNEDSYEDFNRIATWRSTSQSIILSMIDQFSKSGPPGNDKPVKMGMRVSDYKSAADKFNTIKEDIDSMTDTYLEDSYSPYAIYDDSNYKELIDNIQNYLLKIILLVPLLTSQPKNLGETLSSLDYIKAFTEKTIYKTSPKEGQIQLPYSKDFMQTVFINNIEVIKGLDKCIELLHQQVKEMKNTDIGNKINEENYDLNYELDETQKDTDDGQKNSTPAPAPLGFEAIETPEKLTRSHVINSKGYQKLQASQQAPKPISDPIERLIALKSDVEKNLAPEIKSMVSVESPEIYLMQNVILKDTASSYSLKPVSSIENYKREAAREENHLKSVMSTYKKRIQELFKTASLFGKKDTTNFLLLYKKFLETLTYYYHYFSLIKSIHTDEIKVGLEYYADLSIKDASNGAVTSISQMNAKDYAKYAKMTYDTIYSTIIGYLDFYKETLGLGANNVKSNITEEDYTNFIKELETMKSSSEAAFDEKVEEDADDYEAYNALTNLIDKGKMVEPYVLTGLDNLLWHTKKSYEDLIKIEPISSIIKEDEDQLSLPDVIKALSRDWKVSTDVHDSFSNKLDKTAQNYKNLINDFIKAKLPLSNRTIKIGSAYLTESDLETIITERLTKILNTIKDSCSTSYEMIFYINNLIIVYSRMITTLYDNIYMTEGSEKNTNLNRDMKNLKEILNKFYDFINSWLLDNEDLIINSPMSRQNTKQLGIVDSIGSVFEHLILGHNKPGLKLEESDILSLHKSSMLGKDINIYRNLNTNQNIKRVSNKPQGRKEIKINKDISNEIIDSNGNINIKESQNEETAKGDTEKGDNNLIEISQNINYGDKNSDSNIDINKSKEEESEKDYNFFNKNINLNITDRKVNQNPLDEFKINFSLFNQDNDEDEKSINENLKKSSDRINLNNDKELNEIDVSNALFKLAKKNAGGRKKHVKKHRYEDKFSDDKYSQKYSNNEIIIEKENKENVYGDQYENENELQKSKFNQMSENQDKQLSNEKEEEIVLKQLNDEDDLNNKSIQSSNLGFSHLSGMQQDDDVSKTVIKRSKRGTGVRKRYATNQRYKNENSDDKLLSNQKDLNNEIIINEINLEDANKKNLYENQYENENELQKSRFSQMSDIENKQQNQKEETVLREELNEEENLENKSIQNSNLDFSHLSGMQQSENVSKTVIKRGKRGTVMRSKRYAPQQKNENENSDDKLLLSSQQNLNNELIIENVKKEEVDKDQFENDIHNSNISKMSNIQQSQTTPFGNLQNSMINESTNRTPKTPGQTNRAKRPQFENLAMEYDNDMVIASGLSNNDPSKKYKLEQLVEKINSVITDYNNMQEMVDNKLNDTDPAAMREYFGKWLKIFVAMKYYVYYSPLQYITKYYVVNERAYKDLYAEAQENVERLFNMEKALKTALVYLGENHQDFIAYRITDSHSINDLASSVFHNVLDSWNDLYDSVKNLQQVQNITLENLEYSFKDLDIKEYIDSEDYTTNLNSMLNDILGAFIKRMEFYDVTSELKVIHKYKNKKMGEEISMNDTIEKLLKKPDKPTGLYLD